MQSLIYTNVLHQEESHRPGSCASGPVCHDRYRVIDRLCRYYSYYYYDYYYYNYLLLFVCISISHTAFKAVVLLHITIIILIITVFEYRVPGGAQRDSGIDQRPRDVVDSS